MAYSRVKIKEVAGQEEKHEPPCILAAENMENAREAANALFTAFPWTSSAEGPDFWESVHKRLLQIAITGNHKE